MCGQRLVTSKRGREQFLSARPGTDDAPKNAPEPSLRFRRFRLGDFLDVGLEILVLAFEQFRQGVAEILPATPLAHVILPGEPQAFGLLVHLLLVNQEVGPFKEGNQDVEDE